MKILFVSAYVLLLLHGCTSNSTRLMNQDEIEEIRSELGTRRCEARIDSIAFEIEGMIYHASLSDDESINLKELLPDSIFVCPVTFQAYIIEESATSITITCPAGHGSIDIEK